MMLMSPSTGALYADLMIALIFGETLVVLRMTVDLYCLEAVAPEDWEDSYLLSLTAVSLLGSGKRL